MQSRLPPTAHRLVRLDLSAGSAVINFGTPLRTKSTVCNRLREVCTRMRSPSLAARGSFSH